MLLFSLLLFISSLLLLLLWLLLFIYHVLRHRHLLYYNYCHHYHWFYFYNHYSILFPPYFSCYTPAEQHLRMHIVGSRSFLNLVSLSLRFIGKSPSNILISAFKEPRKMQVCELAFFAQRPKVRLSPCRRRRRATARASQWAFRHRAPRAAGWKTIWLQGPRKCAPGSRAAGKYSGKNLGEIDPSEAQPQDANKAKKQGPSHAPAFFSQWPRNRVSLGLHSVFDFYCFPLSDW